MCPILQLKVMRKTVIRNKTPTYHVLSVAVLAIPKTWQPPEAFRCSFLFTLRDFALIREEKEKGDNASERLTITVGEVPSLELEKG